MESYPLKGEKMINKIKKLFVKKKPVIGIDLGTRAIKLIELSNADKEPKLLHIASIPTPEGTITDGVIRERERLEQALYELYAQAGNTSTDVVLCFNGKNLIIRQLRMPIMPEKELAQAVEWEIEKYLPVQKQDLQLEFLNFGEIQSGPQKQLNLLVAALPKDVIYTYYEVFSKTGFTLTAIEVLPLALWHAVAKDIKTEKQDETVFILELGAQATTVAIYRNEKLLFTRSIPLGGNEIDKSISMMLALPESEARKLKEEFGITNPMEDVVGFPEDASEKLQFAIKGTLKDLMQEVQRSISFFKLQDREAEINKIHLVGGLANLKNIEQYFSKELNINTEIYSPSLQGLENFADYNIMENRLNPSFITAYGLAVRGALE